MYNHNKAQQSKNRVHISWDILYDYNDVGIAWIIITWYHIKHYNDIGIA